MHAFYLRNFYVENRLATGTLEIAGRMVDLGVIKSPTYVVSRDQRPHRAVGDGVQDGGLVSGPARFVLGSGGHIAGIVSPPGPEGVAHDHGAEDVRGRAGVARRAPSSARPARGGRTGPRWSAENSGDDDRPAAAWAATRTRCSATRRGATCAPERALSSRRRSACDGERALTHRRACARGSGLSGELAGEAARRDVQRGEHRLAGWRRGRARSARSRPPTSPPGPNTGIATPQAPALELAAGDRDAGEPGDRERAAEPVRRGDGVRGVGPQPAHDRHVDDAGRREGQQRAAQRGRVGGQRGGRAERR